MVRVELHSHSEFSRDCGVPLDRIVAICQRRGIEAIALTDHNELAGALELQRRAPAWLRVIGTQGEVLFRLIVAAYALLGGTPFRARANGWVEARDVVGQATMMGFTSPRFAHAELWALNDPRNLAIREAVRIAVGVRTRPLHRLALRDFHAALLEPGDDAFVYAYRAVEAIRQAIRPTGSENAQWAAMHAKLGTEEVDYQELAKVSAVVRHAERRSSAIRSARRPRRRKWLLDLSREAVRLELESRLRRRFFRL